jgi:peptidoglycan-N-acetylglucosamine deacetylase
MSPSKRSHARRPRHGFARVVTFLMVVFVLELVWRSGVLHRRPGDRLVVRTVAAAAGSLAGPPVASDGETRSALDRLVSDGSPVYCGGGSKRLVALTFDDGPGPYTQHVVDILRRAGARATFFIVAKEIENWPNLANEPRVEATIGAIGDHTYNHIDLLGASQATLAHELGDSQRLIEEHSGVTVRLFRPPYGHHDAAVDQEARSLGMVQVLWSVDSRDGTSGETAQQVLANVRDGLRPGAIVLMHENRGTTLQVLPRILQAVRDKGLRPVTVPELLAADPPSASQLRSGSCQ